MTQGAFFKLQGGFWRATGNPDGWLRLVDTNFSEIRPQLVLDFKNDSTDSTAIRVENEELFCESNTFSGHIDQCDVGMDFVGSENSSVLGGPAESFQGNLIQNVKVLNASAVAFRWGPNTNFTRSTVVNVDAFAGTFNAADEVTMYDLAGDFEGTVFIGPKVEDTGTANDDSNDTADTGYLLREELSVPPLLLNPSLGPSVDTIVERENEQQRLPTIRVDERGEIGMHDFQRRNRSVRHTAGSVVFPSTEVLGSGSAEPLTEGQLIYHDGTDDIPKGLYRADPENSQWVFVEDNTVTVDD